MRIISGNFKNKKLNFPKSLKTRPLKDNVKENILGFDYYDVKDGETPEMIAHKYYGDVNLHWIVLIANDIIDYYKSLLILVRGFGVLGFWG